MLTTLDAPPPSGLLSLEEAACGVSVRVGGSQLFATSLTGSVFLSPLDVAVIQPITEAPQVANSVASEPLSLDVGAHVARAGRDKQ